MDQLLAFIKEKGFNFTPDLDGGVQRFQVPGDKSDETTGWSCSRKIELGEKTLFVCTFGNFRDGSRYDFKTEGSDLSGDQKKAMKAESDRMKKVMDEELAKKHAEGMLRAQAALLTFNATFEQLPEYLVKKKITYPFENILVNGPDLIVPMQDVNGLIWSYQSIDPTGRKSFMKGGKKQGNFFLFGAPIRDSHNIYIAEGFATAASIYLALIKSRAGDSRAFSVVCSFDSGNLVEVARALKTARPDAAFTICCDNDLKTEAKGNGNVGLKAGEDAHGIVRGKLAIPHLKNKSLSDFNDLHVTEGIELVGLQVEQPEKFYDGIPKMAIEKNKQGKPKPDDILESRIAAHILEYYGDNLTSQDDYLFLFNGTHWAKIENQLEKDLFKNIDRATQGYLNKRQWNGVVENMKVKVRQAPVDLHRPSLRMANFNNGTLHLIGNGRDFKLEFKPHAKSDYCTRVVNADYPHEKVPYPKLQTYLESVWEGDSDILEKIRLYKQILGAALMPYFPQIVIFLGATRKGKSTLVKLASLLVGQENCSSVQPSELEGKYTTELVNKMVNYVLELSSFKRLQDDALKGIYDCAPVNINPKYKPAFQATIPRLHLYAGNTLPRSMDAGVRAYGHRMIILKTDSEKFKISLDDRIVNMEKTLWENEPQGILSAAIEGLEDLVSLNGVFTQPASNREQMDRMEMDADIAAQFIDAVRHGEVLEMNKNVPLVINDGARIKKFDLWKEYATPWLDASKIRGFSKAEFYRLMDKNGFPEKRVGHTQDRMFVGIGPTHSVLSAQPDVSNPIA